MLEGESFIQAIFILYFPNYFGQRRPSFSTFSFPFKVVKVNIYFSSFTKSSLGII